MNSAAILAAFDLLMEGATKLAPVIQDLVNKGEITVEAQNASLAKMQAIRDGSAFGPGWKTDAERAAETPPGA